MTLEALDDRMKLERMRVWTPDEAVSEIYNYNSCTEKNPVLIHELADAVAQGDGYWAWSLGLNCSDEVYQIVRSIVLKKSSEHAGWSLLTLTHYNPNRLVGYEERLLDTVSTSSFRSLDAGIELPDELFNLRANSFANAVMQNPLRHYEARDLWPEHRKGLVGGPLQRTVYTPQAIRSERDPSLLQRIRSALNI